MDFNQPNVEIGQKMANGQLLFLALCVHVVTLLLYIYVYTYMHQHF